MPPGFHVATHRHCRRHRSGVAAESPQVGNGHHGPDTELSSYGQPLDRTDDRLDLHARGGSRDNGRDLPGARRLPLKNKRLIHQSTEADGGMT